MEQITDIKELEKGTQIVHLNCGIAEYYEFLMVHPRNSNYVLLLNIASSEARQFYIPKIVYHEDWQINHSAVDVLRYQYDFHMKIASRKLERLLALGSSPKTDQVYDIDKLGKLVTTSYENGYNQCVKDWRDRGYDAKVVHNESTHTLDVTAHIPEDTPSCVDGEEVKLIIVKTK